MVDYRIIMVADFPPDDGGDSTDPTLCVGPPLAPQDCNAITTMKPTNGSRFFHYDSHVDSTDSLVVAIDEFDDSAGDDGPNSGAGQILGGWGTLLRTDSLKFFVEISDDNANDTGGLRFPLCDNDNFDAIFSTIADDVVAGTTLPCTYTAIETGNGSPDLDKSAMIYTPGDGSPLETLTEVPDAGSCTDGAYYVVGDEFTLCPATCDRVRMDEMGKVQLVVGCSVVVD